MAYEIFLRVVDDVPVCLEVVDSKKQHISTYPFEEVSRQTLIKLRLSQQPGLVYKRAEKLYYTSIPDKLRFNGKGIHLAPHLCGKSCTNVCKGCPRTTDLTVAYHLHDGKEFPEAVKDSWRIEKYPFVYEGLEAFNMSGSSDAFIVMQCGNYKASPPKPQAARKSRSELMLGLANFIWPDFDGSYKELKVRLKKAHNALDE